MGQEAERPLHGVRVLEFTSLLPGPFAAQVLCDLGATVVKVERPGGDPMRRLGGATFGAVNRSKRSIELDLKAPADRATALELVKGTDVVLENARPGVMDRLGLGFDALSAENRRLVYVSLSGWGPGGPSVGEPGHNGNYQARAGGTYLTGSPGAPPSEGVPVALADLGGALYGVIAVLAALREPRVACHLDVSLYGSSLALLAPRFAEYVEKGMPSRDALLRRPAHGVFPCADGESLTIAAVEDHFWPALCLAIDHPDLAERDGLQTYAERLGRADEIDSVVGDALLTRSRDEWVRILRAHDVPVAPVLRPEEAVADPQARHLGAFAEWPDVRAFLPVVGLPGSRPPYVAPVGLDGDGASLRGAGWVGVED